jgi:hypothetical protein
VVKVAEEFHFSEGAETEHGMVERCNLFNRNFLSRRFMQGGPKRVSTTIHEIQKSEDVRDNAISALSDDIYNLIILRDIKLNLAMTPTRHTLSDGPFTRCRRRRGRRKRFLDNGNRHSRR